MRTPDEKIFQPIGLRVPAPAFTKPAPPKKAGVALKKKKKSKAQEPAPAPLGLPGQRDPIPQPPQPPPQPRSALDRKSTRLNSSHSKQSRMPSSA